jgi:hypothetical protein
LSILVLKSNNRNSSPAPLNHKIQIIAASFYKSSICGEREYKYKEEKGRKNKIRMRKEHDEWREKREQKSTVTNGTDETAE